MHGEKACNSFDIWKSTSKNLEIEVTVIFEVYYAAFDLDGAGKKLDEFEKKCNGLRESLN